MLKDLIPHQFKKKVYEGGIENSPVFKKTYGRYYKDPISPVFYTKIVEDLAEANGRKAGIYNQTRGILINFRGEATEEKKEEFRKELVELASKYDEIVQMANSNFVNLAIPEPIRVKRIVDKILKDNSCAYKRLYKRKKREKIESVRYTKSISQTIKKILKEVDMTIFGEYYKNSEDVEMIILTDNKKLYKNTQAKEMPADLFWHLQKLDLFEILDDREFYKKFYFKEEFIKNFEKYIKVRKSKNTVEK